jgi:hypothetical protein
MTQMSGSSSTIKTFGPLIRIAKNEGAGRGVDKWPSG